MISIQEWTIDECVEAAINWSESQIFERKGSGVSSQAIANLIVAFANADGGLIAIGVEDITKSIKGFKNKEDRASKIREDIPKFVAPPVSIKIREVHCKNTDGDDDYIILIQVERSNNLHENQKRECYLRIGATSKLLNYEERKQLEYDKGQSRYESTIVPGISIADIDSEALSPLSATFGYTEPIDTLRALNLVEANKATGLNVTVAGFLLFGKNPQIKFPKSTIRVIKYDGVKEETGKRLNIVKDKNFDGNLVKQVAGATSFIQSILKDFTFLNEQSGLFITSPEYPREAWQETIVNAVVHRSYSMSGLGIEIKIFDNRIEVSSPGNLPHSINLENILNSHYSRNPLIMRAFYELRMVKELGEGMNRMFEAMEEAKLPPPKIEAGRDKNSVSLILENDIVHRQSGVIGKTQLLTDKLFALDEVDRTIVLYTAKKGAITSRECRELLKVKSPQTAITRLANLIEKGYLERHGSSPQDPKAYYNLTKTVLK